MAKSKRKRNNEPANIQPAKVQKVQAVSADVSASLFSLISRDELDITIDTLKLLAEDGGLIKSKACKDLRVAVFDFRQACTTGVNTAVDTNLTARISAALTDGKLTEARILLAEMRIRNQIPKLGALCRWVRDLDVVSGLSLPAMPARSPKETELLLLLDAVLRLTGPTDTHSISFIPPAGTIHLQSIWNLRDETKALHQTYASVLDKSIMQAAPCDLSETFTILETTPASLRKPPNQYPAILHTCRDDAIRLSDNGPSTSLHKHPIVPNLSLIKDVLSPSECTQIIATAETIGFTPDAPLREEDGLETSILAHNFYWITDVAFSERLWRRVQPYLPETLGGRRARGVNRRWRVYRYVPGAEYRMHIDGAWPPSGIDAVTGAYMWDSSPPSAKQSSLFTFLIYLNDEFEGGETTFFLPSVVEGVLNAYPVKPVMGSVAVFPHGETTGALLHEGTGVRKGAKYVVRTDVEYDIDPTA